MQQNRYWQTAESLHWSKYRLCSYSTRIQALPQRCMLHHIWCFSLRRGHDLEIQPWTEQVTVEQEKCRWRAKIRTLPSHGRPLRHPQGTRKARWRHLLYSLPCQRSDSNSRCCWTPWGRTSIWRTRLPTSLGPFRMTLKRKNSWARWLCHSMGLGNTMPQWMWAKNQADSIQWSHRKT